MRELDPKALLSGGRRLLERAADEAFYAAMGTRAGLIGVEPPRKIPRIVLALQRFGLLGGAVAVGAIRHSDRVAVRDERGDVTYTELHERSNALANAWRERGLRPGEGVAILARNHRGFFDAVFAAAKCGARIILLNTSFAGPQIREAAEREGTDLLVYDDEYSEMLGDVRLQRGSFRAWVDEEQAARREDETLEALIGRSSPADPPRPARPPKIVILTSGTTGTPKGAPREEPRSLALLGGFLSKVPLRARETTELCVPAFHTFGFATLALSLALGSTIVVRRHFDPERTVESLEENRATALIVVPVMLQRILDLGEERLARYDTSSLRVVFMSGSQLGAETARRGLRAFGPVLYNLYGSTEVAYATIATPADLREEPGCVGRVVHGAVVRILDDRGQAVPAGESGRIFVGNSIQFEGYTGGGTKERIEGLMATGDVGHFDRAGRLFIDGRDDEMIVSGGENVFPGEVEELLAEHEAIAEAAVIGVEDERFGQRLKAFVVVRDGRRLTDEEVKAHVRENLARYKVPREVAFLGELPRNPTGKVLKRVLREQASADQEPGGAEPATAGTAAGE